jgi:hypothetical protein
MVQAFNEVAKANKVHKSLRKETEPIAVGDLANHDLQSLHNQFPGFAARNHPVNLIVYTDPESLTKTLSWLQSLIKASRASDKKIAQVAIVECDMRDAINSNGYNDEQRMEAVDLALPRLKGLKIKLKSLATDQPYLVKAFRQAHIATSLDDGPTMALFAAQFSKKELRS